MINLEDIFVFIIIFWMIIFGIYLKGITNIVKNANKYNLWNTENEKKINQVINKRKKYFKFCSLIIFSCLIVIKVFGR